MFETTPFFSTSIVEKKEVSFQTKFVVFFSLFVENFLHVSAFDSMENMSRARTSSSPELRRHSSTMTQQYDDSALEGVAANIKLLLKLVEDHKDACSKAQKDSRRMLRVAGMMTILDMVRTRIQKCQSFGSKRSEAELRQCNTDLRGCQASRDKKPSETPVDEKEKLRRELTASLAARKSMEVMCSSLGKEKEIMANELARKVQQLSGMEEHINDLKAQNKTLLEKVKEFHAEHKEESGGEERETIGNAALEARNKMLSAQLVRSIDGYRSMKWKLKEVLEENSALRGVMEEMGVKVESSLERIRKLKQRVATENGPMVDIEEEIAELECVFEWFDRKISKYGVKGGECAKPSGDDD